MLYFHQEVQKKFGEVLSNALSAYEKPCTLTKDEKMSVLGGRPDVAELCRRLKEGQYQKVVVMTGAGVSVSAGIPDFRSPGSGLYATLDLQRFQLPSPQAVFDINFFRQNPEPFFMLSKELFYAQDFRPTVTHHFIKLLADKGLLCRCFTQVHTYVHAVTGRKPTLFHCKWANSISYISRMQILCVPL